ncbi:MAG: hypothetical protein QG657_4954 [Acidobacteriota bacterium]|nr:hypothetical protein [Acidobacteriota bacterium]
MPASGPSVKEDLRDRRENFPGYLPDDLEKIVSEDIAIFEEEQKMNHVLSWEKIARKEGKKEGKIETLRTITLNLLKKGVCIDNIIEYTDLSRKEIEELAATVK